MYDGRQKRPRTKDVHTKSDDKKRKIVYLVKAGNGTESDEYAAIHEEDEYGTPEAMAVS